MESNHKENRTSIHEMKNTQQDLLDGQHATHRMLAEINTKLNAVYGTDQGKPGEVDRLEDDIERNRQEAKDDLAKTETRLGGKIESVRTEMRTAHGELSEKVSGLTEAVNRFNVKWALVAGGAAVVGFLLSHLQQVVKVVLGK
jgi:chromosome segregation ATPase